MTLAGYFVSDLHLLSRRSRGDEHWEELVSAVEQSRIFVLGGDIFDFKWSEKESLDASIETAVEWLHELIGPSSECAFHYLLGNHDSHTRFVEKLDEFATYHDCFQWHPHVLRMGACVFLHGDIIHCRPSNDELDRHRQTWDREHQIAPSAHWIYDQAVRVHLHRIVGAALQPRQSVLKRIYRYLREVSLGPECGVRHVYFGHTHRCFQGIEYGGLVFHNPGAAIHGIPLKLVPIEEEYLQSQ